MAISKILHMKDSGNSFHARHLKRALDYVMNPEKTQGGRLVGAINCQTDMAFEQMMDTKKQFGKTDKRQGYHIILSFKEDEVEPDRAFEITQKFVAEYLGDAYEWLFAILVIAITGIGLIGTVNHPNMHMTSEELMESKKSARTIVLLEGCIILGCVLLDADMVYISYMAIAVILCAALLCIAKIFKQEVRENEAG